MAKIVRRMGARRSSLPKSGDDLSERGEAKGARITMEGNYLAPFPTE
jgi:hypothetical protein